MINSAKYFIVWVEGIEPKGGEKIKHFRKDGSIEYTLDMMEAMRVKKKDIGAVKIAMKNAGVANWVLEGNTFISTSYAPKGTIWGTTNHNKIN
jgi:uncharacterized protein (DUF342 family)